MKNLIVALLVLSTGSIAANNIKTLKEEFAQQFSPIKKKVTTRGTMFSFSKTKKELDALHHTAQSIGKRSPELCEWYNIYTLLLSKREDWAYQLIPYGTKYIKACAKPSDTTLPYIHFRMYKAYSTIDDSIAPRTDHFEKFISLWEKHKLYDSPEQLIGQKEQLGYLLQENKEYAKALKLNLSIEDEAHKLGIPEKEFMNLYNNIAQNYYDLKDPENAKKYLEKRLAVSRKNKDIYTELNTLFQLAVLAYETNDELTAERLFKLRLEIANDYKSELDSETIDTIKRDLSSFYKKTQAKQ